MLCGDEDGRHAAALDGWQDNRQPNYPVGNLRRSKLPRRAAQRGRSKAEFIAKLGISLEEIDECCYWLELIMESGLLAEKKVKPLHTEADELTAIFTAALKTAKQKPHVP